MTRVTGLTGATLPTAPTVCHECTFWQAASGRSIDKRRWIEKTEDEWGAWGTVVLRRRRPAARLDAVRPGGSLSARL